MLAQVLRVLGANAGRPCDNLTLQGPEKVWKGPRSWEVLGGPERPCDSRGLPRGLAKAWEALKGGGAGGPGRSSHQTPQHPP